MRTRRWSALFLMVLLSGTCVLVGQASKGQQVDPLSEGNRLFEARDYQAAALAYRALLDNTTDVPTAAKAWFNLGLSYQKLNRHQDAIGAFREIFDMNVNDREVGGHIMEPYRNYRSRAQWQVGQSLFATGDYQGALEAYLTTKLKYPFQSWCNVEEEAAQEMYALHEGLTYEHLGMYREAVGAYFRVYAPRLVDLYEAAGQLADLKAIISQPNPLPSGGSVSSESGALRHLQDTLDIHTMAEAHEWAPLFDLLRDWSKGGGNGRQNYLAKMLARYPQETLPLLRGELNDMSGYRQLVYQTIGLMGTPEAVATLKELAETEDGIWSAMSLVHALSLAGELGRTALNDLDKRATGSLKIAIDHLKSGRLQELYRDGMTFPSISAKPVLPRDV